MRDCPAASPGTPEPGFGVRLLLAAWNLTQLGMALYGLGVITFLIARTLVGERWALVAFGNNFVPWLAAGGLVSSLIALASCRRRVLIALQVPGMAAFLVLYAHLLWPPDKPAEAINGVPLTVVTFNMFGPVSDPQRVVDVIAALDADVIGLQEVGPLQTDLIAAQAADEYPYQVMYPGWSVEGVGLLSRYPILEEEPYQAFRDRMWNLRAVLDINGTPVTVYVAHPSPPTFYPPYDDSIRDREIQILLERLNAERGPLLLLCDCNMSDLSDNYRQVDRRLNDAFGEIGWGLGFTFSEFFAALPPIARIDYVWYSKHFAVREAYVGADNAGGDHRPVVAELVLRPGL